MRFVKFIVVLLVWLIAVLGLIIRWVYRLAAPNTAVDIIGLALSPMFLLEFAAILALAAWVYWRWAVR